RARLRLSDGFEVAASIAEPSSAGDSRGERDYHARPAGVEVVAAGRRQILLHEVLTYRKFALSCAASFNETPSGRVEGRVETPHGVLTGQEGRGKMCGYLRRN